MIKERIDIENLDGQLFELKIVDPDNSKSASFTHYLHNYKNGVSQFYKKDALSYVKEILEKEYPEENVTNKVAEEALQYLIFDLKNSVPFPGPKSKNSNLSTSLQELADLDWLYKTLEENVFLQVNGTNIPNGLIKQILEKCLLEI